MMKFCSSCHTANRDSARFCRGCAGKFSGVQTPANALDSTRRDALGFDAALQPPTIPTANALARPAEKSRRRWPTLPAGMDVSVLWLLLALTTL